MQRVAVRAGVTAETSRGKARRAAVYRGLRRLHLALSLLLALPLAVLSLTGALLVFGHELESLVWPRPTVTAQAGAAPLAPSHLMHRVGEQRPDAKVWALVPAADADEPWRLWLAGGGGLLLVDPYDGRVLAHERPNWTPYGVVKALHRRWLVSGKPASDWARTIISSASLALMVQVGLGLWMWGLPSKRLRRLRPEAGRSMRLLVQRLHLLCGVLFAVLLLLVAFTGLSMYWHDSTKAIVEAATASRVETLDKPAAAGLAPVADLDAAVALARAQAPEATVVSIRPPAKPGEPVHVALRNPDTHVNSRAWIGDDPPRVLAFFDGRQASAATWFWQFRYWLHIGDFAGWPVRVLWLPLALSPLGFAISGLWLWRDRRPRHTKGARRRLAGRS